MIAGMTGDILPEIASRIMETGLLSSAAALVAELPQFEELVVALVDLVADDDLILAGFSHDTDHAFDGLHLAVVRQTLILQSQAQARHAVVDTDDVALSADFGEDFSCGRCVIHNVPS